MADPSSPPASADGPPLPPAAIVARVVLPFGLGYLLSYLYRNLNAVIAEPLTADLALSASDLGLLTAMYFFAFAGCQIPMGLALDRYGPRRVEAVLLCVAACGGVVFAIAESILMLALGRAMIGAGLAACLMAAFKANVLWWPAERLPLLNGLFMISGGIGAMAATRPVEIALTVMDWRDVLLVIVAITLCAALILWLVVPDRRERPPEEAETLAEALSGLRRVAASRLFWRLSIPPIALQGVYLSYQSLWTGPWLREVSGLDPAQTANGLLALAVAMTIGFPTTAALADRLRPRGIPPLRVVLGTGLGFVAVQAALVLAPGPASPWLWIGFAILGTGSMISYAVLAQSFPVALSGRVITLLNLLVFAFAFLMQSAIGLILDLWAPDASGIYPDVAHRTALACAVALQLAAMIPLFRRSESP